MLDNLKQWFNDNPGMVKVALIIVGVFAFFRIDNPLSEMLFEAIEDHLVPLSKEDSLVGKIAKAFLSILAGLMSLLLGKERMKEKMPKLGTVASGSNLSKVFSLGTWG